MQPMSVDPVIEFLFALSDDEQIREEERSDATRMLRVRLHRFLRENESNPFADPSAVDMVRDMLASVEAACLCPTKLFIPDDLMALSTPDRMFHLDAVLDA